MEKYESVREKIRKLQALAERGYGGEVMAAKAGIERLCDRYVITPDELLEIQCNDKKERYTFAVGRTYLMRTLFTQCCAKVLKAKRIDCWTVGRDRMQLEITKAQYIELNELYEWHKANLERERDEHLKLLVEAYAMKHNLYSGLKNEDEDNPLTHEDLIRLRKLLLMESTLADIHFQKQLESK
jgi:hypothetical protein